MVWKYQKSDANYVYRTGQCDSGVGRAGVSKCGAQFEIFLRGPTQWCVEIFEGEHGVMIEIGDVTNRGPKRWRQDLYSRDFNGQRRKIQ